jgi:UDP:flavonoid glycosyltransferase YjiC (YdhE family)
MLLTDTTLKKTVDYVHKNISPTINLMTANELGVMTPAPPGLKILAANSLELDYPFAVLPKHVVPCGPIIRSAPNITSTDPSLEQWLQNGPTVYVNLGTHLKASASEAAEMAKAFRELLNKANEEDYGKGRKLQILWKLQRKLATDRKPDPNDYSGEWKDIRDILGQEMDADLVRITDWVTAEPYSVLASGHVVCSVHHGGANSFNESIW